MPRPVSATEPASESGRYSLPQKRKCGNSVAAAETLPGCSRSDYSKICFGLKGKTMRLHGLYLVPDLYFALYNSPMSRDPIIRLRYMVGSTAVQRGLINPGKRQISVPGGGSTLTHHQHSSAGSQFQGARFRKRALHGRTSRARCACEVRTARIGCAT
jgi:hypothetical protein